MTLPIALQTYTVREHMGRDFEGTTRRVAAMGYGALETTFEMPGTTLSRAANLFRELALRIPAAHTPLPLDKNQGPVLDYAGQLGLSYLVAMHGPDDFKRLDQIRHVCDQYNQAAAVAAQHGLGLAYHNHFWEIEDDCRELRYLRDHTDPANVSFLLDVAWVHRGGGDPATVAREFLPRIAYFHLKDTRGTEWLELGQGDVDLPGVLEVIAGQEFPWAVIEQDETQRQPVESARMSRNYLRRALEGNDRPPTTDDGRPMMDTSSARYLTQTD